MERGRRTCSSRQAERGDIVVVYVCVCMCGTLRIYGSVENRTRVVPHMWHCRVCLCRDRGHYKHTSHPTQRRFMLAQTKAGQMQQASEEARAHCMHSVARLMALYSRGRFYGAEVSGLSYALCKRNPIQFLGIGGELEGWIVRVDIPLGRRIAR